jgi:hypothetical protein
MPATLKSLLSLTVLACGAALAQAPAPAPAPSPAPASAKNPPEQRIEQIRTEDQGTRIDELRVGGQTQSITVTPKASSLPGYEIQPTEGARTRPTQREGAESSSGPRVWNVLKF